MNEIMKGNSRKKTQVKVCDVCGDKGFSNALIDCSKCPDTFAHQYCMGIPPGSVDSSFTWVCEDCCELAECWRRISMMPGDVSTKSSVEACDVSIDVTITNPKMKAVTPLCSESCTRKGKGNKQKRKSDSLNPNAETLSSFRSRFRVKRLKDQSLSTNKGDMGEDITTNMSAKVEAKSKSRLRPKVSGHANNNLKLRNEEKGRCSNDESPIDPGIDPHSKFDCQNIRSELAFTTFQESPSTHKRVSNANKPSNVSIYKRKRKTGSCGDVLLPESPALNVVRLHQVSDDGDVPTLSTLEDLMSIDSFLSNERLEDTSPLNLSCSKETVLLNLRNKEEISNCTVHLGESSDFSSVDTVQMQKLSSANIVSFEYSVSGTQELNLTDRSKGSSPIYLNLDPNLKLSGDGVCVEPVVGSKGYVENTDERISDENVAIGGSIDENVVDLNVRLNVDEDNFEAEIPYHRRPLTRRQSGAISKAKNQGLLTVPDSSIELSITIDDEGTIDCNVPVTKRIDNVTGSSRRKATVVRKVIVEEQPPKVVDKECLCEVLEEQSLHVREEHRLDLREDKSLGDQRFQDATEVEFVPPKFNYDSRKLKTRITSNPLCDVIDLFTNEQRLAICDMGFGGFLKISCKKLPQLLPSWLVHHFDPKSCSLKFIDVVDGLLKELPITENDVHLCIGLPQGPNRIVLPESEYDNDDGFYDFVVDWRRQHRNVLPVTTLMPKHFMKQTDGGVDFKRNFIVFIVSSFFLADQSVSCKVKALKTCINVDEVCNFNWCEFVVHRLVDSVSLWRKNPRSKFTGPIFVLMMIFLDRVLLKRVDRLAKRVFPTVCGWTTKKVKDYVRLCTERGGLGQGVIYDPYDKSVDCMPKSSFYRDLIQGRRHHGGDELRNAIVLNDGETMKDVSDFCDFKSWVQEMKTCTKNVAVSMERFHSMLERGIDNFGSNGVAIKLRDSALNLFKSFLSSDVAEASTKTQARLSDDFIKDPDVVVATCYLVDAADRMISRCKKDQNIPNFRLFSTQDEYVAYAAEYNLEIEFADGRMQFARPKGNVDEAHNKGSEEPSCVAASHVPRASQIHRGAENVVASPSKELVHE